MRSLKRVFSVLVFVVLTNAYGRGGDIIGNGGGLVESNFVHAYSQLSKIIKGCIKQSFCVEDPQERKDLIKIKNGALANAQNIKRLIFASEKSHPGLFYTHDVDKVRLAVTGLKADSPIYVNLDLLYKDENGREVPAMEYGEIVAILVHEAGHNVGLKNHTYLDYLGSLVRRFIETSVKTDRIQLNKVEFSLSFFKYFSQDKIADFWISWNEQEENISEYLYSKYSCEDGTKPTGIQYENYHQERLIQLEDVDVIPVNVWAKMICSDGVLTFTEYLDVKANLVYEKSTQDYSISLYFERF
ncbi:MAG: hypothetical protein QF441_04440 [Bacteriovoracaceae bacterium]|jgi:hypothetical protein|nr:hypothetical protein [Halobacteriovoraceae bacterium]MDP7319830.1 hypothetical protein [Bacteriovoracaceae bacterium]